MSAKKLSGAFPGEKTVAVSARQARLELPADKVSILRNGIEFHSPTPFHEWAEVSFSLQAPHGGEPTQCSGVVVSCTGNKHAGYHISVLFTGMSPQAEKQVGVMARAGLGAG